jgi:hypothetical protein
MKYVKATPNSSIYKDRTIRFLSSIIAVIGQYCGIYKMATRSKEGNIRYRPVQDETHRNFQISL